MGSTQHRRHRHQKNRHNSTHHWDGLNPEKVTLNFDRPVYTPVQQWKCVKFCPLFYVENEILVQATKRREKEGIIKAYRKITTYISEEVYKKKLNITDSEASTLLKKNQKQITK